MNRYEYRGRILDLIPQAETIADAVAQQISARADQETISRAWNRAFHFAMDVLAERVDLRTQSWQVETRGVPDDPIRLAALELLLL